MFEQQYDAQMEAEIKRLEGKQRAVAAGHPEWENACAACGGESPPDSDRCGQCRPQGFAHP